MQVEDNGNAETAPGQTVTESSKDSEIQGSQQSRYAPSVVFEDGSVMFSAADLEAADYEAVLNK